MPVKFEQNRMGQTSGNFELFDKKTVFYNHFKQRVDAILEDVSEDEIFFLMLNYQLKDYHLSALQKLRYFDTCNQVKSCTKHGRPDQSQWELTVALKVSF